MRLIAAVLTICAATLVVGCGSSFPVLISIAVTPSPAAGKIAGPAVQFTATGTFSDFSTSTNIPGLTWSSSDQNTATITANGAASCVGGNGTPITITASAQVQQGGPGSPVVTVMGTAQLTCTP